MTHALTLSVLPDTPAISRLDASTPMPERAGSFFSITRTRDEVWVVYYS